MDREDLLALMAAILYSRTSRTLEDVAPVVERAKEILREAERVAWKRVPPQN